MEEMKNKQQVNGEKPGQQATAEKSEEKPIVEVVEQKSMFLGKQVQTYVKDFATGECAETRKISVGIKVSEDDGPGFGMLAKTYSVNQAAFDASYYAAEVGDACSITTERTTYDGKTSERVKAFLIRKPDGKIYGIEW